MSFFSILLILTLFIGTKPYRKDVAKDRAINNLTRKRKIVESDSEEKYDSEEELVPESLRSINI